jgi:predicted MFS family arabinose efflux permease
VGSLAAGLPALLAAAFALSGERPFRLAVVAYALLMAVAALPYLRLSPTLRLGGGARRPLSPESRRILLRLSLLFGLDGLGGGLLVTALLSYFFFERFGAGPTAVAALFFVGRLANVFSHFAAAWLARRIGLVNTMVFTHLPSSLLLVAVALTPSFAAAAVLFVLREALVEMDVPTRQSYVMAVVAPEERAAAAGVTHLVRLAAWAVGPLLAGWAMSGVSLAAPLVAGAALKIAYDLLLYARFRGLRPPEERRLEGAGARQRM